MKFFVPYQGEQPAALSVKGHRVVLVSAEKDLILGCLEEMGANQICELNVNTLSEQEALFGHLAKSVNGGVVVAPQDADLQDIVNELEAELPWVH